MTAPNRTEDVAIEGVHCQLRIGGSQGREYKIEILPVKPWPSATSETASNMMKAAGLKRNTWTTAGPFDAEIRRDLVGQLEWNYQTETLPSEREPDKLKITTSVLAHFYVGAIIDKLEKDGFPKEAMPFFKQFAIEDFTLSVGLTIGQFWKWKKGGN